MTQLPECSLDTTRDVCVAAEAAAGICTTCVVQMSTGQMTEEERKLAQQKAMQNPEIQLILTDPIMRQVLLGPSTGHDSDPSSQCRRHRLYFTALCWLQQHGPS